MATSPQQNEQLVRLLARVGQRDQAAFAELYSLTSPHLFGVALRILNRQDRAEDVLQEAFVNVWNQAGSYAAGLSAPMTWLTSVVRNKSLDWLRHVKLADESTVVMVNDDGEDYLPQIADERADPQELFAQATEGLRLRHCLGTLEAAQRQSLALAYYDGLSHSELAEHLRAPLGTVKAWVRRGLEKLKKCLDSNPTPLRD
ncbi:MAG: sigma-70 family RNA polymerase sigma factor [Burkholderiaceae bacterium]|nr:MAG: sigma-70 family RNA polymerase sigma factor [Burkholderiaceae bacterium]